jgi:hypothetical protein
MHTTDNYINSSDDNISSQTYKIIKGINEIIKLNNESIANFERKKLSYVWRTKSGVIINYYFTTNKISFQGKNPEKITLEKEWNKINIQHLTNDEHEETHKLNENEKEDFLKIKAINKDSLRKYIYLERKNIERNYKSDFSSEDDLKAWFLKVFSQWFTIHSNVKGIAYANHRKSEVEADFILQPNSELIENNITETIGVEVKFINPTHKLAIQLSDLTFQAMSYAYCSTVWKTETNNQKVELKTKAFLIFTNLSFSKEKYILSNPLDRYNDASWKSLLSMIYHANVGEIQVSGSPDNFDFWAMRFGSLPYCYWGENKGVKLGNEKIILKHEIGNVR